MNFNIAQDIAYAKEYLSLNETQLAQKLGVPRSSLLRWEKGQVPSANYIERIYSWFYREGIRLNSVKEEFVKDSEDSKHKVLYHGAKSSFELPIDLTHSKENNDFGKGFYLGESFNQAGSFVYSYENSSVLAVSLNIDSDLKTYELDVDEEWMICIAFFRNKLSRYANSTYVKKIIEPLEKYDIIKAPIADNRMYQILDEFIEGNITDLQCKSALSASSLGKQYVLKTDKAIKGCTVLERCYVCREERDAFKTEKNAFDEISSQKVRFAKREYAGKGKYIDELIL